MHIQLETGGQANLIRTYTPGLISVNQDSYTRSLIVLPGQIISDWPPQNFEELTVAHIGILVSLRPELLHTRHRATSAVSACSDTGATGNRRDRLGSHGYWCCLPDL